MAVISFIVDAEHYGTEIQRIRDIGKSMLDNADANINPEAAVDIIQVALKSLKHPSYDEAGKRLVQNLVNPTEPSNKSFNGIEDLIGKLSTKITSKKIFDEARNGKKSLENK
ncbi:hypothetical protein I4U23_031246 [Adineta vaga]|nr:hypothetical protein I4U23_031246 [Adineta vaga]